MKRCKKILAGMVALVLVCAMTACNTSWVAKVDDDLVSSGIYIYFLMNNVYQAYATLSDQGAQIESEADIFKNDIDGKTAREWIVEKTLDYCQIHLAVERKFAEMNLKLDQEDEENIKGQTENFWGSAREYCDDNGVSKTSVEAVQRNVAKQSKIFYALYGAGGEKEVKQEDLNNYFYENYYRINIEVAPLYNTGTGEALPEGDAQQVRSEIDDLLKRYNNGEKAEKIIVEYRKKKAAEEGNDPAGIPDTLDEVAFPRENSELDQAFMDKLKEAPDGKAFCAEADSGSYKSYLFIEKLDVKGNDQLIEDQRDAMINGIKNEEFGDLMEEWGKEMKAVFNDAAVNRYKPENIRIL